VQNAYFTRRRWLSRCPENKWISAVFFFEIFLTRVTLLALSAGCNLLSETHLFARGNQMKCPIRVFPPTVVLVNATILFLFTSLCVLPGQSQSGSDKRLSKLQTDAERGGIKAAIELASRHLKGDGVPQDATLAARWYERAAQAGDCSAQNMMGVFYQSGTGVPADPARAAHWYQIAAASDCPSAKLNLGLLYLNGVGLRKDISLAMQLFEDVVRRGDGAGAAYLGQIYEQGLSGTRDLVSAEKWFQLGVKLHDPIAAYCLAQLYSNDAEHIRDLGKVTALLRQAADTGYVPAIYELGSLLHDHPKLKQASGESLALLDSAASAGDWRASILLGIFARDGKGVPVDKRSAAYHFQVAVLQGGDEAERRLRYDIDQLNRLFDKDERAAIASAAHAWYMQHSLPRSFTSNRANETRYFDLGSSSEIVQRTFAGVTPRASN
jgi:TPR repeat protein